MTKMLILLSFLFSLPLTLVADNSSEIQRPPPVIITPHSMSLNAASWILMDYETGDIVSSKNINLKHQPASLSKIMTSYIIAHELEQGSLRLDQKIPISDKAAKTPGSKMFIAANTYVTVKDLLDGLIIQSGNDAAVALAEFIAGSDTNFVKLMNKTALALGMKNTNFATVDGLPGDNQYTTAYDIAILSRAFIAHYPAIYKIYSQLKFKYGDITQKNRNKLLTSYNGADGIKTGFTSKAGYNLAASAIRNGQRYISVILGAPSSKVRENESIKLLNFAFSKFTDFKLYEHGSVISLENTKIPNAKQGSHLAIMSDETLIKTIPRTFVKHLTKTVILNKGLKAPIDKGHNVGHLVFSAGEHTIASIPIKANNNIDQSGILSRIMSYFK